MSKLFLMAGTKGGIGKSLFSSFLVDIASDYKHTPVIFDCDDENRSLSNMFCKTGLIIRQLTPGVGKGCSSFALDEIIDEIARCEMEKAPETEYAYILDMKAGTTSASIDWMQYLPLEELQKFKVKFHIVGCITSDIDSCVTFSRWITRFFDIVQSGDLRFLIVKNEGFGNDFSFYDEHLKPSLEEELANTVVVHLPACNDKLLQSFKANHTSMGQVAKTEGVALKLSYMTMYRLRVYFHTVSSTLACLFQSQTDEAS